jgi:hypothetical protein
MSRVLSILCGAVAVILLVILGGTLVTLAGSEPQADPLPSSSMGTAFTYQGSLSKDQEPVDGSFEFVFSLYGDPETGEPIGDAVAKTITITKGLFTTDLDFGTVFDGTALWLEIRVRPEGSIDPYTALLPRQRLTPAPMAVFASSAPWNGLTGVPVGFSDNIDNDTAYQPGAGLILSDTTFAISSTYLLPQPCSANQIAKWDGSAWQCDIDQVGEGGGWSLAGNSGTVPGPQFLGTTDDVALELRVNGERALRLEPGASSPNVVGGYGGNSVSGGAEGATIGGGGRDLAIQSVSGGYGTVSGGAGNSAPGYAASAGGGEGNSVSGSYATVGGGSGNAASGANAAIAGGSSNAANAGHATVSGGYTNTVSAGMGSIGGGAYNAVTATYGTVGGGRYNVAAADYGTVAGGGPSDVGNPTTSNNHVYDEYGTIGGGGGNTAGSEDGAPAAQPFATVSGGKDNVAGATYAAVGGGSANKAGGYAATVGGGEGNIVTGTGTVVAGGQSNRAAGKLSTVSGGSSNVVSATLGTVGGGTGNLITTTAGYGIIPGGVQNYVGGPLGFAAGYQARAEHQGSFVWSDATGPFTTTAANQFLIDASGGVGIGTNEPSHMLTVAGDAVVRSSAVISVGAIVGYPHTLQAPRALYAVGDLLYAAGYATNTLSIWNVTDPTAEALIGYTTFQLQGPVDLQVVGNRAYLASQNRDMLTILDVSDPADISHVGDTTEYLDYPQGLHVSGKYAYVASMGSNGGYDGLTIFDVSDAPAEIAATSFVTTYLEGTSDVFVVDSYAYVTSRDNSRLVVFDVSDPRDPTPVSYTEESLFAPVRVHVSGIYAYVVDEGADTVAIFDVSNPAQIAYQGQITTDLTHPRSIYVSGDRAYVAYAGDDVTGEHCGLAVLDISDPADIPVPNVIDMSDWLKEAVPPKPVAVTGSGDRVYLANEGHDSVTIFEIDGLEASAVRAGELQVAHLEVTDYAAIEGDLGVRGGLNVGPGGALIQGALTIEGEADSYVQGRLGIGPVATVITRSVSPTESEELVLPHPTHQLDVDGEARFRVNDHNHLVLRSRNTGSDEDAYIDFVDFAYPDLITPSARIEFDAVDPVTHSTSMRFYTQGPDDAQLLSRLEITAWGDVRPGADGAYLLGIPGRRWHTVYSALPYGLAEVTALRPVIFNWAENPDDGLHYGLIAQEVREFLPDIIAGDDSDDGILSMSYSELVPVLVKAVQEQQEEIDTQADRIADLEARLSALEDAGSDVETRPGALNSLPALGFGGLALGTAFFAGMRRKKDGS